MALFKVGDRVQVTSGDVRGFCDSSCGLIGTVELVDSTGLPVLVFFDNGDSDWGKHEELQLVVDTTVTKTDTLAEKLDALDKLTAEIREMVGL